MVPKDGPRGASSFINPPSVCSQDMNIKLTIELKLRNTIVKNSRYGRIRVLDIKVCIKPFSFPHWYERHSKRMCLVQNGRRRAFGYTFP